MARHALFPETIIESDYQSATDEATDDESTDVAKDDLDALLATLGGWSSQDKTQEQSSEGKMDSSIDSTAPSEEALADQLQEWRTHHIEQHYDKWSPEKKEEFKVSLMLVETMPNTVSIYTIQS